MSETILASILAATLAAGTPLALAALGELVTEKSGVLNLGTEGTMAVGAIAGFAAAWHSGSTVVGALAGIAAGAAMALLFAFLALTLAANQVASGLALSIFGVGLAAFAGRRYESATLPVAARLRIPGLADLPAAGALFDAQWPVYASWLAYAAIVAFLYRSRAGLALRAIGESPQAAHAIGYPVLRIRYAATLFGGAMAGFAGSFLSVFHTPLWSEGLVSGRGWIALALVVFATWRPARVLVGAYLFGGVMIAQLFVQGSGWRVEVPSQLLSALPYAATIVVLVAISRNPAAIRLHSPASLGKPCRPGA